MIEQPVAHANEWLLTDGYGGYAMGNTNGVNTRRYHALWMPAVTPPTRRVVGLRGVIDALTLESGETMELATQHFGPSSALHPDGQAHLIRTCPRAQSITWTYSVPAGGELHRMLHLDCDGATLTWTLRGTSATLRVRPLVTLCNAHHLLPAPSKDLHVDMHEATLRVRHTDIEAEFVLHQGQWQSDRPDWWADFRYPVECERGYDSTETALAVGVAECLLNDGDSCTMTCRLVSPTQPIASLNMAPRAHNESMKASTPPLSLNTAAAQFVVQRQTTSDSLGTSIIAGYPWFADWGRDAMISLPGLLLSTQRFDDAKAVLDTWASAMHNGLLPNRFDDVQSKAHYDTADASLWFIHALMQWMQTSGQRDNALLDAAMQVVKHYCAGTDFGIGIHEGLVEAGQDGYALTWMDAKTDEFAITPRVGKPIELSALWHNGLLQLASHIATDRSRLQRCAKATSEAFGAFWNSQTECCFDVLDSGPSKSPDAAIRPNQLFACSVEHSPLSVNQRRSVLRVVQRHLLTPFGLRTLSPQHPDYIGACSGTQAQRDKAYHNGTVWPWLIGPWIDAHVRLGEEATLPSALLDTMRTGCVGQLAEIFDGDAPHTPRGCPAQAWSVAEVLRHTSPVGQACVHEANR